MISKNDIHPIIKAQHIYSYQDETAYTVLASSQPHQPAETANVQLHIGALEYFEPLY